jgi:hypothetical protein
MTELDKLIEAVEAGTFMPEGQARYPKDFPELLDAPQARAVAHAYLGSLDAAKALHEALLPGWVTRHHQAAEDRWHFYVKPHISDAETPLRHREFMGIGNPARAWLLATLKAFRATQP